MTRPWVALAVASGLPCLCDPVLGVVGEELDPAGGGAGAGVDALGQQLALGDGLALGLGIEDRLQQLIQIVRRNPARPTGLLPW